MVSTNSDYSREVCKKVVIIVGGAGGYHELPALPAECNILPTHDSRKVCPASRKVWDHMGPAGESLLDPEHLQSPETVII